MTHENHLEMIQSVISRISSQATTVKGWCVTIVAALLGYGASTAAPLTTVIAVYVVAVFAVLDGYYLSLERAYRVLYRDVVTGARSSLGLDVPRPGTRAILAALRSPAIVLLYGTSLVTTTCLMLYLTN
ncbi:hypothetical protein [Phytohabitans suffuscus]|uniref:Uncharacterized protein n=1 Tax=Phytohabitans suffuscus TaxID=624315 RepID=A0A6F8YVQ2_9ACTN|nr:hypothetical protein [Phytohabitans suffuscus]BCB90073.1 hypothetical protein Psuf_073860 [Phytohabitans suffuscus]